MIGGQASGDGALDLLAVQRDDELLDLLAARVAVPSDDELVRLLVAWRDEVDDGLPGVVPAPRSAPDAVPTRTAAVSAAALSGPPATDLLPAGGLERSHRRRLTATGTAAALVLGGTLSVSGVAAAVTGDPLAPYRAVGHAFSIGGDSLPEQAADVAQLNKRLTRARAAVAHGDLAGAQAAVDELTAQLAGADLTEQQRGAIERRLASLRTAIARVAAADAERGRNEDRAEAAATAPPHGGDGRGADADQGDGDDQSGADASDAGSTTKEQTGGSTKSTKPDGEPASNPTTPTADRPDPADEVAPEETTDQDQSPTGDSESGGGDQSGDDTSGGTGRTAGGGSSTRGRSAGTTAALEQAAPEQARAARAAGGGADRR